MSSTMLAEKASLLRLIWGGGWVIVPDRDDHDTPLWQRPVQPHQASQKFDLGPWAASHSPHIQVPKSHLSWTRHGHEFLPQELSLSSHSWPLLVVRRGWWAANL